MTQPAVHGQDARHEDQQGSRQSENPGQQGPDRTRGMSPWRKAAVIAAAGVPVGLLWWLLAPSGLNLLSGNGDLRSGSNTDAWLPRDLVLAALFLLAGCIAGVLSAGSKNDEPSGGGVALAVLAGGAGAVIAWGTGVLCGAWWGTAEDTSANASIAFSLRSYAVLAIWPAAGALSIFLAAVFAPPHTADAETDSAPGVPSA